MIAFPGGAERTLGWYADGGVPCLHRIRVRWRNCPVSTRLAARNLFLVSCHHEGQAVRLGFGWLEGLLIIRPLTTDHRPPENVNFSV
jgi:hypothetical protein